MIPNGVLRAICGAVMLFFAKNTKYCTVWTGIGGYPKCLIKIFRPNGGR